MYNNIYLINYLSCVVGDPCKDSIVQYIFYYFLKATNSPPFLKGMCLAFESVAYVRVSEHLRLLSSLA